MKTKIVCLLLFFALLFPVKLFSQAATYVTYITGQPSYVLLGNLPKSTDGVYQKLKVDIFGGDWRCFSLAETSFYISTRDKLLINKEIHGGESDRYQLKVYDIGNGYDFVLEVGDCASLLIQAWLIEDEGILKDQTMHKIVHYDPAGKAEVTNSFAINTLFATNEVGNVGIGLADPREKLDVDGKILSKGLIVEGEITSSKSNIDSINSKDLKVDGIIKTREILVTNTGWADFVFHKDYKLPTLQSVKQHIETHNTLPGIPSEKEVQEKGVNLSEMNIKLLQKVEELTLYILQQEKRISELESKLK